MSEKATVIKEIQSRFTANITDYRKKVEQLSGLVANMTKNLGAVQRTAASAMKSPSESTQKLGRALDATVRKLQGQKEKFDGLTKSGERTAQQMEQLSQKLAGMSSAYHAIQAAADTIDLSTPIQKQADEAKAAVAELDAAVDRISETLRNPKIHKWNGRSFIQVGDSVAKQLNGLSQHMIASGGITQTTVDLEQLKTRLKELRFDAYKAEKRFELLQAAIKSIGTENLGYANAKGLEQLKSRIDATTSKLGSLGDKMSGTATKAEHLAGSMQETKEKLDQQSESLSKSSRRFDTLKNAVGRFASSAGNSLSTARNRIAGIGASASGSTSRVERLLRSIRRISLASLALRVVRPIFGELTSCVNRYMEQNAAAAASIERLRNGLTNALAPAINVVINLLNQIMPYLIGIADAVASLITNIFGTGWTTVSTGGATAANSVADSAGKASDKVDDLADSTNDAAAAQEKYNKLIAGFDEITKLEEQPSAASGSDGSGGGSGGSGGGSGGATQTTAPGTEGIAGKLPEWLSGLIADINNLLEAGNFFGIGERIADTLNNATAAVDGWINNTLRPKGVEWAGNIAEVLNGLVSGYDWELLGKTFGDGVVAILDIGDTFLVKVDFTAIGRGVATALNRALKTINKSDVNFGKIVADLLNAGIDSIWGFVSTVSWSDVGDFVAENVNRFFETVKWEKVGETASKLIDGLGEMLSTAITKIDQDEIKQAFEDFMTEMGWKGELALDVALAFGTIKSVGAASKILNALGIGTSKTGAAAESSSISSFALPVLLVVGASTAYQGFSGLYHSLFGTDEQKTAAKEKAENSGIWWTLGKEEADKINKYGPNWKDSDPNSSVVIDDGPTKEWWSDIGGIPGILEKIASGLGFSGLDEWSDIGDSLKNLKANVDVALVQNDWTTVKDWVTERIGGVAESAVGLVKNAWTTVKGWVSEHVGGAVESAVSLVKSAWTTVKDWVSEHVGGAVESAVSLVKSAWTTVKEWVSEHVGGAVDQCVELVRTTWTTVKDWVAGKIGGAIDFLVNLDLPEWLQELLGIDNLDKKVNVSVTGSKNVVFEEIVKSMGGTLSGSVQKTANAILKGSKGTGFSNITTYNSVASKTKTAYLKGSKGNGFSNITTYNSIHDKSVSLKVGVKKNGATTVSAKPANGLIRGMLISILGSGSKLFSLKFAARGGIVDAATLFGNTVVGEAGKEAIIPLENHTEWIDKVADRVAQRVGNGGGEQTVNVYVTLDGSVVGKSVVKYVNGVAKSTGVNPLSAYI